MSSISLIGPLRRAYERTKLVLWTPFDVGIWFLLGFSAWLAQLEDLAGSFSGFIHIPPDLFHAKFRAVEAMLVTALAAVGILLGVIGLIFFLAMLWIDSRGKFIFLDNLIGRRARIVEPWHIYQKEGNSLLFWNLGLMAALAVFITIVCVGVMLLAIPLAPKHDTTAFMLIMFFAVPLVILLFIALSYMYLFLQDFIVPLMYKHRETTHQAWRRFRIILKIHFPMMLLYGLVRLLMSFIVGNAIFAFGLLTCCCGFILISIPYIGTVILLPIHVFIRYYSIEFLKQFGADYNVDAREVTPPLLQD